MNFSFHPAAEEEFNQAIDYYNDGWKRRDAHKIIRF
jgi:hypothetical protein